jgi:hypothetical protein
MGMIVSADVGVQLGPITQLLLLNYYCTSSREFDTNQIETWW